MGQEIETLHLPASTLFKAVAGAAVVAGIVLTCVVWPAETGYDPTGIGEKLGLTGMSAANAEEGAASAASAAVGLAVMNKESIAKTTAYRSDEKTFTLAPHSGIEIKAHMAKGDSLIFRWESDGPVKMDMHGEPPHPKEGEFTTYWKEKGLTSAQGSFTAGFEGRHGWYWRNKGETPVTIKLQTAGFYKDLFEPKP